MKTNDLSLWNKITFKTLAYRKNFDIINDNENIITEYDGYVSETRISEEKPPMIIGEYGFSVWNIRLGKDLNVDFNKLIYDHRREDSYCELLKLINDNKFNIYDFNKILIVHTLIVRKDFRKSGITQEFTEMLYRDFYNENVAIIALVKPFQDNKIDADFYYYHKTVKVKNKTKSTEINYIPAIEYYSLKDFDKKNDSELNEYKLFSVANNCGFKRIDDSYLFTLNSQKTIERIIMKKEQFKQIE
jgi:hypothetical protein